MLNLSSNGLSAMFLIILQILALIPMISPFINYDICQVPPGDISVGIIDSGLPIGVPYSSSRSFVNPNFGFQFSEPDRDRNGHSSLVYRSFCDQSKKFGIGASFNFAKVMAYDGSVTTDAFQSAIKWLDSIGTDIIITSLNGIFPLKNDPVRNASYSFVSRGGIFITSVGNLDIPPNDVAYAYSPSSYPWTIGIGGAYPSGEPTGNYKVAFGEYGFPVVDFIETSYVKDQDGRTWSGTSFAAPRFAADVVSFFTQIGKKLSTADVMRYFGANIKYSAISGFGIPNVDMAVANYFAGNAPKSLTIPSFYDMDGSLFYPSPSFPKKTFEPKYTLTFQKGGDITIDVSDSNEYTPPEKNTSNPLSIGVYISPSISGMLFRNGIFLPKFFDFLLSQNISIEMISLKKPHNSQNLIIYMPYDEKFPMDIIDGKTKTISVVFTPHSRLFLDPNECTPSTILDICVSMFKSNGIQSIDGWNSSISSEYFGYYGYSKTILSPALKIRGHGITYAFNLEYGSGSVLFNVWTSWWFFTISLFKNVSLMPKIVTNSIITGIPPSTSIPLDQFS